MVAPDWIAVDWGTTRLRVWAMDGATVLQARASERGMGSLAPAEFEPALLELTDDWLSRRTAVVACGMVGARTGWAEAEYRAIPCTPLDPLRAIRPPSVDARLDMHILPGLSQAAPPDVMRGEETQIAGFLAQNPDFRGTLCLPGTHCKWVRIADGRVECFQTFMTGELFALLSERSVLRLSLGQARPDPDSVLTAVRQVLADPAAAAAMLFPLRAAALLHATAPEQNIGRLSGVLIGAELAACRAFWRDDPVAIIGATALSALYTTALTTAGAQVQNMDAQTLVLSGLYAACLAIRKGIS